MDLSVRPGSSPRPRKPVDDRTDEAGVAPPQDLRLARLPAPSPAPDALPPREIDLTRTTRGELPTPPRQATRRWARLVAAGIACTVAGVVIGSSLAIADRRALTEDRRARDLLTRVATALADLDAAGRPLDPEGLSGLLAQVQDLDEQASGSTGGAAWQLARLTTRRTQLTDTTNRLRGLGLVADAAGPLRASLADIRTDEAGTPAALDAVARDLSRLASVSLRARQLGSYPVTSGQDPSLAGATPFEQLATAAAVLPGLAGAEAPRRWVVCRSATAGCSTFVLDAGQVSGVRSVAATAREHPSADVTVVGRSARDLLTAAGWSVPAVLDALAAADGGEDDDASVVTSTVPSEQRALDVLAGRA